MSAPVESIPKLKEITGAAPWTLLHCFKCNTGASHFWKDTKYTWSVRLECRSCNTAWRVCTECPNIRVHLCSTAQANRHNCTKHRVRAVAHATTTTPPPNPPVGLLEDINPSPTFPLNNLFQGQTNIKYFEAASSGTGPQYLITQAIKSHASSEVLNEDIDMMMSLSHFVSTLTRSQREELATVLCKTNKSMIRQYTLNTNPNSIPVPTTKQQLRTIFCEGSNSVQRNLPHPLIQTIGDHSYILPSDCLKDFLGHGAHNIPVNPITQIHQPIPLGLSAMANSIHSVNLVHQCDSYFLSLWSDDFEPNYSKSNRGSVWIMTITIHTTTYKSPTLANVYPIAVGRKGTDHNKVVRIIINDINTMKKNPSVPACFEAYDGSKKTIQKVSAHLICITQDQPERRSFCGLLAGGKTFHCRWGYAAALSQISDKLIPCPHCLKSLVENVRTWSPVQCSRCFCFMQIPETIRFTPSDDFPEEEIGPDGLLPCTRLSFDLLMQVVDKCHGKVREGKWDKTTSDSYLKSFGINTHSREKVFLHAANQLTFESAREGRISQEQQQAVASLKDDDNDRFRKWKYPPIWESGLSIQQLTEPSMHQLFLGIEKNLTQDIQDWCSLRRKSESLRKSILSQSRDVEKLHLSWCKMQPYVGDKLGGWISENYLAFSRIGPWIYSYLLELENDEIINDTPNKPIQRLTVKECKSFLKRRNLLLEGNVLELRERVRDNLNVEIPESPGGPLKNLLTMIVCKWLFISHLMGITSVTDEDIRIAERNIRLFLWSVAEVDKHIVKPPKNNYPIWISQYNYMCLLNFPKQMEKLGPIRNRWEGGVQGEGYLRKVKPLMQKGGVNWQKNLLSRLLRYKALDTIMTVDKPGTDHSKTTKQYPPQSFKIYPTQASIRHCLDNKDVLSCVLILDDVFVCYKHRGHKVLLPVSLGNHLLTRIGIHYFELSLQQEEPDQSRKMDTCDISSFGILLPGIRTDDPTCYSLFTSDWRSFDLNKKLKFPHDIIDLRDYI